MDQKIETMAREFLEEFFRLGRYHPSRKIGTSMRGEAFLLMYLWKTKRSVTPGELGKAMKTSSARIAAALNNLERKGQIVRKTEKKDRRKTLVELTPQGEIEAEKWKQAPFYMVSQLMERLGEEDSEQLLYIIKRINEIVPQMEWDGCKEDNRGGKDDIEV